MPNILGMSPTRTVTPPPFSRYIDLVTSRPVPHPSVRLAFFSTYFHPLPHRRHHVLFSEYKTSQGVPISELRNGSDVLHRPLLPKDVQVTFQERQSRLRQRKQQPREKPERPVHAPPGSIPLECACATEGTGVDEEEHLLHRQRVRPRGRWTREHRGRRRRATTRSRRWQSTRSSGRRTRRTTRTTTGRQRFPGLRRRRSLYPRTRKTKRGRRNMGARNGRDKEVGQPIGR